MSASVDSTQPSASPASASALQLAAAQALRAHLVQKAGLPESLSVSVDGSSAAAAAASESSEAEVDAFVALYTAIPLTP